MENKPSVENLMLLIRNLLNGKSDPKLAVQKIQRELPKIKAYIDQLESDCRVLQEAEDNAKKEKGS